jgi:ribosomal protein L3 glutamine methyltransferase
VPFYVDQRVIVPRSLIAEPLADGTLDAWLSERTRRVLDLCTGNGSLAVLAAMAWPEVHGGRHRHLGRRAGGGRRNVVRHGTAGPHHAGTGRRPGGGAGSPTT